MRKFAKRNVLILFLVIITTIDASRLFYLPLPRIHSSHYDQLDSSPSVQKSTKQRIQDEKILSDEFIPISAMERNIYEEDDTAIENNQKRDSVDWELLFGKKTRHHIPVREHSRAYKDKSNYLINSDDETALLRERVYNKNDDDNGDAAIDRLSQSSTYRAVEQSWSTDGASARAARLQVNDLEDEERSKRRNDALFLVIVGTCSFVGILGLVAAAIFWYRIQKKAESALDAEYPSYGITGPGNSGNKISPSSTITDRKLAQSAQMFHYQQQRQQMMAQEKAQLDAKPIHSDDSDDEGPTGGDYTVYECPGLAPTGEMEVRNPLFAEPDSSVSPSSFVSHPTTNSHYPQPTPTSPLSSSNDKSSS